MQVCIEKCVSIVLSSRVSARIFRFISMFGKLLAPSVSDLCGISCCFLDVAPQLHLAMVRVVCPRTMGAPFRLNYAPMPSRSRFNLSQPWTSCLQFSLASKRTICVAPRNPADMLRAWRQQFSDFVACWQQAAECGKQCELPHEMVQVCMG